jgi:hypothetical protein
VFTARYVLSPYIKQIRFVFKGLTDTVTRNMARHIPVSIKTRLQSGRLTNRDWFPVRGQETFYSANMSRPDLGSSQLPTVTAGVLPGPKQLGHEFDHSFPSSAEVKIKWGCNYTPLHAFTSCVETTLYH